MYVKTHLIYIHEHGIAIGILFRSIILLYICSISRGTHQWNNAAEMLAMSIETETLRLRWIKKTRLPHLQCECVCVCVTKVDCGTPVLFQWLTKASKELSSTLSSLIHPQEQTRCNSTYTCTLYLWQRLAVALPFWSNGWTKQVKS